jgi:hypothetical protein
MLDYNKLRSGQALLSQRVLAVGRIGGACAAIHAAALDRHGFARRAL